MTQATHLFFDHPYEPGPEERGYYWATRFTNTKKTFGFMPGNLYANADVKRNGGPTKNLCGNMYKNKCVFLKKPENIAGNSLFAMTVNEIFLDNNLPRKSGVKISRSLII